MDEMDRMDREEWAGPCPSGSTGHLKVHVPKS